MERALSKSVRGLVLAAALAFAAPAFATYVFTTVDYPGTLDTLVFGLTNTGRVGGSATFDEISNFGFTYSTGVFTPLPPAPLSIGATGINDSGVIVGGAGSLPEQGFVFSAGAYSFFSRPGWTNTEARAINNAGLITGYSYDLDGTGGLTASSGFIYDPAASAYVDIPWPGSTLVIAQGINAAGQVVGSAQAPGTQSFLREPDGTINSFQVGGLATRARGINDSGLIAGWVSDGAGIHAFVASSSGYELLDAPGAVLGTFGEAINNAGQIAGNWQGADGALHGFIATPAAMPTGTTSGGAYVFGVDVVPNVPIFIDPPVAVGYDYAIGKHDPRVASVQFPIGIGDNFYLLKVAGQKFVVAGGEWFDFRAHGFPRGVTDFRVGCIDTSASLDPANAQAFPTGLTFVAAGRFTGTQKPRTRNAHAHDGAKCRMDDDEGDD